jgi:hypothetical protein
LKKIEISSQTVPFPFKSSYALVSFQVLFSQQKITKKNTKKNVKIEPLNICIEKKNILNLKKNYMCL